MKLELPIAEITAVTNLQLKQGQDPEVPGKALTVKARVGPAMLNEFRAGLRDELFNDAKPNPLPRMPEVEILAWATEYEKGTLRIDLTKLQEDKALDFLDPELMLTGVVIKKVAIAPLTTGMADLSFNAVMKVDDALMRGKLDALKGKTMKLVFSKLAQVPLFSPEKPKDDAAKAPDAPDIKPLLPAPETTQ